MLVAPFIFLAAFAACVELAQAVRRRPMGLAPVLGAALMVSLETLFINGLSIVQAVGRPDLLVGNAPLVFSGFAACRWRRGMVPLPG